MSILAEDKVDIVSNVTDLSDVPLADLSASTDAELARTLQRIIPGAPDDKRTSISAFNSCI
jgi:FXSXX-COOH protein